MKPCRYLEHLDGEAYCVYWDSSLRRNEDLRCYPNGWECYEEPGGCIFEGRWMTLTEYGDYLESKSERELPEGYECQEFRLDDEGLAELPGWKKHYSLESMTGEFHYLKIRSEYPKAIKAVVIARFRDSTGAKRVSADQLKGSEWVASLWIDDGFCQMDLAAVLREDGLEFIEGHCLHGDNCPDIEMIKWAILGSGAFVQLREDLIHELFQRTVADLHPHPAHPLPSPPDGAPQGGG